MSKKHLLAIAICIVIAGGPGSLHSRSQNLTMSLDQLYQTAEENNTSIKSFNSAVEETAQGISSAKAERLPDINASLSASYLGNGYITDRDFSNGASVHIPHLGTNFALKASWAVYTGGAVTAGIDIAKLSNEIAKVNALENRNNVRFLITGFYLQLHSLQNQIKVFDENISLTDSLLALTHSRYTEGVVLQNDITRYELQLENLKLAKTQAVNKAKIINHQLITTLGIDENINILTSDDFELEGYNNTGETEWQNYATQYAPSLLRSKLGIKMSEQKEKLEQSERLPKIALFAEDHIDGPITFEIPNLNNNFHYWYVGVNISYNLGSLYKSNKKVKQARTATRQVRESHEALAESVENSIQAAYTDYLTCLAELETNTKSVQLASQNYDIIFNRYSNGLALVTDMVDAANQRLNAQLALVNSRINIIYNYYNLKRLSGTI